MTFHEALTYGHASSDQTAIRTVHLTPDGLALGCDKTRSALFIATSDTPGKSRYMYSSDVGEFQISEAAKRTRWLQSFVASASGASRSAMSIYPP